MHNLRRLPDVLASVGSVSTRASFRAKDWVADCNLPSFINDILEPSKDDCHLTEESPLSRVVAFSKRWIDMCLPCLNMRGAEGPFQNAVAQAVHTCIYVLS